jgi:hypothetical protein
MICPPGNRRKREKPPNKAPLTKKTIDTRKLLILGLLNIQGQRNNLTELKALLTTAK